MSDWDELVQADDEHWRESNAVAAIKLAVKIVVFPVGIVCLLRGGEKKEVAGQYYPHEIQKWEEQTRSGHRKNGRPIDWRI